MPFNNEYGVVNLNASSINGSAPLTVGFFLADSTISDKKRWHFGDELEENNNLLCTHTYQNTGTYVVWVDILNEIDEVVERSNEVTVNVNNRLQHINFNQWEAIVYEGNSVGFSISHDIVGDPRITWDWGDGTTNSSDDVQFKHDKLNPHHVYDNAGTYAGRVTITEQTAKGNGITESKEFTILVLQNLMDIDGFIQITSVQRQGNEGLPINTDLTFQAQVTGVDNNRYSFVWDFGDKNGGSGLQTSHRYSKSGTYHVRCTIRDKHGKIGNKIVLCKTVVIQ